MSDEEVEKGFNEKWLDVRAFGQVITYDKRSPGSTASTASSGFWPTRSWTQYGYRCLVAIAGFGANPIDTAVYLKAGEDDDGEELNAKNKYILHFNADELPPVGEHGFWSVTAYGDDDFLISNPIERYAISNQNNFKLNKENCRHKRLV